MAKIVSVVRFDGAEGNNWLVYRHPEEGMTVGSQLLVQEGQTGIFVKDGAVCDVFAPGRHTLSAQNLPILKKLVEKAFDGKTPFGAEVYFVNTLARLDIKWGTDSPIQLIDPKYSIKLRVRAYGRMGMKVTDPVVLFRELIGAMRKSDVVEYKKVCTYYRGMIVAKAKSAISEDIITNKISALEMSARIETLSAEIKEEIAPVFASHGLSVLNFYINSINFPDEDFEQINKILADKAAFDIMGDRRYTTKRSLDVYESAAGNSGGLAGTMAAGGIGLGTGMAMADAMRRGAPLGAGARPLVDTSAARQCPSCHASIPADAKFCPQCGARCSGSVCECGASLPAGTKFCPQCGKKVE